MNTEYDNLKNVVIGFDTTAGTVRVFRTNGFSEEQSVCTDTTMDMSMLNRGEYGECLKRALGYYIKNIAPLPASAVVLPNKLVASDYIQLPLMKKNKLVEALKTELRSLYNNIVNQDILTSQVDEANGTADKLNFFITMASMDCLNDINKGLAVVSVPPRITSFSAACSLNTALYLMPELAGKSFMFADIREKSTVISFCSDSKLRGFCDLAVGHGVLHRNAVVSEFGLFDRTEGFSEVYAAVAKAVAQGNDEGEASASISEQQSMVLNRLSQKPDYDQSGKKEQAGYAEHITEEEFIAENFKLLQKWIMLFYTANSGCGNIPFADFILVNLPKEFYFLRDVLGEQNEKVKYEFINNSDRQRQFTDNFDLFGALLLKSYNPDQVL